MLSHDIGVSDPYPPTFIVDIGNATKSGIWYSRIQTDFGLLSVQSVARV
jgi:hypothetical protein